MYNSEPTRVSMPSYTVTSGSTILAWVSSPQELYYISQALALAVDHDFMAREHAAKIWKRTLSTSGFDLPKDRKES